MQMSSNIETIPPIAGIKPVKPIIQPTLPLKVPVQTTTITELGIDTGNLFKNDYAGYFVIFLILSLITWLMIFILKPKWSQEKNTGVVSMGLSLFWAVIIGLILTGIVWLFRKLFNY